MDKTGVRLEAYQTLNKLCTRLLFLPCLVACSDFSWGKVLATISATNRRENRGSARSVARKIFIVHCQWLGVHPGLAYAFCLKVLDVLDLDPALVGQTAVNDKVEACRMQRVMALAAPGLQVLVL